MKTLLTALAITTFALHAALAAPQEIPKGSKLRAQLFDLARPTIDKLTHSLGVKADQLELFLYLLGPHFGETSRSASKVYNNSSK
jgi:hypothetical protein